MYKGFGFDNGFNSGFGGPAQVGGGGGSGPVLAVDDRWGNIGDSMTYGNNGTPYMPAMWVVGELSGLLYMPPTANVGTATCSGWNMGVSGQPPAQYLARLTQIQAANLDVALIGGIENAAVGVTAGDLQTTFGTIFSGLTSLKRIYVTPVARTKSVMANPTLIARADAMDAWFAAASATWPNVRFLPNTWNGVELTIFNGTAWVAGADSYDGTHQNPRGAREQAANMASDIRALGDMPNQTAYDAVRVNQLNTASAMTGTAGTFTNMTGQLPTGYVGTNTTGATVVASIVNRSGRNFIRLEITGTCTTQDRVRVRRTITHTHVLNDAFEHHSRIAFGGIATPAVAAGHRAIGITSHSNARWMSSSYGDTNGLMADVAVLPETVVRTATFNATAGNTSFTVDLDIRLVPGAVSMFVEWGDLRSYNMTQEGLV